ncbi:SDR family oxidoreductase [Gluconobacter sp. LMG 1744]|uniref:Oxidoreductase n=1 Tax=Gluconobacter kondonii TaxID=941463 RepID=A0ABQ5WTE1_9PROT|nr:MULTISPECIES: SDR family oxidoreductase [Gluconobacter]AQS92389.1 oxidoreductase [Gluconobacter albidus]MBF0891648.1 SDR family oxidoreductase [Gluconobacter cadivus]MBS1053864.1 SDR family oxidoreductase [Gluconobacter kondonii]MBS1066090.1 SDR family oxidoreductase [Gluconobacter kondonii]MBS1092493.1 SDR family oxidoreductase [Gluconobacter sp. Dm-74]
MLASATRKILVIGGSRGIGAAIVARFAAEGDDVSFTWAGSQTAAEAVAARTGAHAIRSDASDRDATIALLREIGPLDVLVYNSALLLPGDPLTLEPDAVDHLIDVNIRGPYFASVEAARQMSEGGRIILIGSVHGDRMPFEGLTAYGMSKSALQGLARGLARDFGARDITVNVVQPGPTNTDMNPHDGPLVQAMHDEMALKRHGTAEDVAHLVAYLVGPHASGITGAMHTIDGGFGA